MSKKLLCCSLLCAFMVENLIAQDQDKTNVVNNVVNGDEENASYFWDGESDGFLNIKASHERSNRYAFGPKNASAVGLNPVISMGAFTLDTGLYYGRQFSNMSVFGSERFLSKTVPGGMLKEFHESIDDVKSVYSKAMSKNTNDSYFLREYTRLLYKNDAHNFRVVLGDTTTRNTIGSQQAISGAGVSIFRQSGNGSVINAGSPIVITRPSKIDCKLGDDILVTRVLAPGTYYLDDLPEEVKIPGVKIKITDQLNKNEVLTVDYFGGYGMLKAGEDDFDLSVIYASRYDIDDPCRIKYANDPHFSGNYRRGLSDELTVGAGAQVYKSAYIADITAIFGTEYGKISPHLSFSHDSHKSSALATGVYYMAPVNEYGITFETFLGTKEKGFSDLRRTEEFGELYNNLMAKYFTDEDLKIKFKNTYSPESSRQIIARVYSRPIFGFTPSFTFNGAWSKTNRLREYTLSCTTKVFDQATMTVSAGLTYDDPTKGVNQESPDRRLTVALTIPFGDFKAGATYKHHDEEKLDSHAELNYTPSEIKGLEFTVEEDFRPGYQYYKATGKYECDYFDVKVDDSISNSYLNSASGKKSHSNQQRAFIGTSISTSGFGSYRKSSVNVLRTAYYTNKKAEEKK